MPLCRNSRNHCCSCAGVYPEKADGIQVKKTYVAEVEYSAEQANDDYPLMELDAEEMAELWVNGKFAGVSFWNKHRFDLKGLLHPGSNAFKLVVTGSLANRYGKRAVPTAYRRLLYEFEKYLYLFSRRQAQGPDFQL